MAKNKIIYGNETLIDLTSDTVSPNNLLLGETAHDRSGESIQGSLVVANNRRSFYGTCTDSADTVAKQVTLSNTDGWELVPGTTVSVKFSNSNTATGVTLNINETGAKKIWYNQSCYTDTTSNATTVYGAANQIITYVYDGTYWVWLSHGLDSNTTYSTMADNEVYTGTVTTAKLARADRLKTDINKLIDDKVNALDVTVSGASASKTLSTLSEADGKISATFQNIQIAESQVTNLTTDLGNKVDKVSGKDLSTNDYTTTEKDKLAGIAEGAEVNQNAFAKVKVNSTTINADAKQDTLELVQGTNVTLTPDATNDKVTIAATDTTYTISGGTNKITVTPSSGDAYDVTVTPSISNNITGSGTRTSGYLAKFSGTNTVTNGPQLGNDSGKYLKNDGTWDTPAGTYTLPVATSDNLGGIKIGYSQSGKNYPVQLSSQKAYVNVPWTDSSGDDKVAKAGDTMTGPLKLKGATTTDMSYSSTNPQIQFANSSDAQGVKIIYGDYDSYRPPYGLKIVGDGSNYAGAWLEVEGDLYAKDLNATYYNIHPENTDGGIIPFITNDLAYLTYKGGSYTVKSTTATNYTTDTISGTTLTTSFANAFDGAPTYVSFNRPQTEIDVIEITCHKTFTYSNTFYIDFGSVNWRAKDIKVLVRNSETETTWTQKGSVTGLAVAHWRCKFSHSSTSGGSTVQGFNQIRIVLTNYQGNNNCRVAQIGLIQYSSAGAKETLISRGGCAGIYGSLIPQTTDNIDLGSSSKKWKNGYFTNITGTLTGNVTGNLTGDVTGNCSGTSSNVTGTVAIANGGTGATTRLNAAKAFTNENVGTGATHFITMTTSWGKFGYSTVANVKSVLGLGSAAYTASSDYATSSHTHGNITNSGTITSDTAIATGDKIVAIDADNNKVIRSGIAFDTTVTNKCLTQAGTWAEFNKYSLPLAASGTRGGIKIGYSESGQNYAVKLNSEKAYVTVPWTDTRSVFYGTCATAAATRIKEVTLNDDTGFSLTAGVTVYVKFSNTNTYSSTSSDPTQLKVGSTAAKNIYYGGSSAPTGTNTTAFGRANYINAYTYNGSYWVWMGSSADNNTTYSSKTAASGGTDTSLCTTGEKYTWNSKAAGNHTHTTTIDTASLGSTIYLEPNTNYTLTAGGTSCNFFTPNKVNVTGVADTFEDYYPLTMVNNDLGNKSLYNSNVLAYIPKGHKFFVDKGTGAFIQCATQFMAFAASNEADYRASLGVLEQGWGWTPEKDNKLCLGRPQHRWKTVYAVTSTINTSDRNAKKDIKPLNEQAKDFIMSLKPVSYKLKDGESGRTHYGMIAQDVEEEMTELDMTAMDFAGLCKDQKTIPYTEEIDGVQVQKDMPIEGEYTYGLRYEEFIAPMIKTIQLQQEEINELKQQLAEIKTRLDGGN